MRRIHKGREPRSLTEHRKKGLNYEEYKALDELRTALLAEQGHLCCYCLQRIQIRAMHIEHWDAQSEHTDRTVDYDNLLGACTGGENILPKAQLHCDAKRKNVPLHIHPARPVPNCEQVVKYLPNGEVSSDDALIHEDLAVTLNLNSEPLVNKRKQVSDRLISTLCREHPKQGPFPVDLLQKHVTAWQRRDHDGKLPELCQIVLYYLEKKLKKRA